MRISRALKISRHGGADVGAGAADADATANSDGTADGGEHSRPRFTSILPAPTPTLTDDDDTKANGKDWQQERAQPFAFSIYYDGAPVPTLTDETIARLREASTDIRVQCLFFFLFFFMVVGGNDYDYDTMARKS